MLILPLLSDAGCPQKSCSHTKTINIEGCLTFVNINYSVSSGVVNVNITFAL